MSSSGNISVTDRLDIEKEGKILKTLRHDNIVKIIDIITEEPFMIVMELIDGGSLSVHLKSKGPDLTVKKLLYFSRDIASVSNFI